MNFRQLLLLMSGLFVIACAPARETLISVTYNNLSNSYIFPYRILINGKTGIPASLIGCSDNNLSLGQAIIGIDEHPRFVYVKWEHLLTQKVYEARINLESDSGNWWKGTTFQFSEGHGNNNTPTLVIQWRDFRKVAVMLVATPYDFSKGKIELGIAEGKETERPNWGPKLYLGYPDYQRKAGDEYFVGNVTNYNRIDDPTLPSELRYGCPRLPDGRLDTSRLPPQKLPFITGPNGEHIPCADYFCRDKQDLIKKLRKLGWREYQEGQDIPAIEFGDAPNPEPAR